MQEAVVEDIKPWPYWLALENIAFWIILLFIVVFIILIIQILSGNPFQKITNFVSQPVQTLGSFTTEVLVQGTTDSTTSLLVMNARPVGTLVQIWNQGTQSITVLNDNLATSPPLHTTTMGSATDGILNSGYRTVCINVNGNSVGTAPGVGSWYCTQPEQFV